MADKKHIKKWLTETKNVNDSWFQDRGVTDFMIDAIYDYVNEHDLSEREANKDNSEDTNCAIFDVSGLLRELIMRGNYCAPMTEQDLIWFEEGTDHKKCKDFMLKIFEFVGEQ